MSQHAIRVENLSKRYMIAQRQAQPEAAGRWPRLVGGDGPTTTQEAFWALQDVSFEVAPGERLGIVGGNGAGKSTLLKVLSQIVEPTQGRVEIRGRVASLLEVGTGFHPELSGRENIYLNGALLGMPRREIKKKFDDIVAFAEVDRFLDTPVKRYSSGMYIRLAFAVAAHLESQVLIVDEVLAVGDAKFQERCLGKMNEAQAEGRTVLFVSHSMAAIASVCNRALMLERGRVVAYGDTPDVVARYLATNAPEPTSEWRCSATHDPIASPYFKGLSMAVVDEALRPLTTAARADQRVGVLIEARIEAEHPLLTFGFALYGANGEQLFSSLQTDPAPEHWPPTRLGDQRWVAWIPAHFLNEGDYRVELHAALHARQWFSRPGHGAPTVRFSVRGGFTTSPRWAAARPGLVAPVLPFAPLEP